MVCPLFIIFVLVLQERAAGNAIAATAVDATYSQIPKTNGCLSRPFTCDEVWCEKKKKTKKMPCLLWRLIQHICLVSNVHVVHHGCYSIRSCCPRNAVVAFTQRERLSLGIDHDHLCFNSRNEKQCRVSPVCVVRVWAPIQLAYSRASIIILNI